MYKLIQDHWIVNTISQKLLKKKKNTGVLISSTLHAVILKNKKNQTQNNIKKPKKTPYPQMAIY